MKRAFLACMNLESKKDSKIYRGADEQTLNDLKTINKDKIKNLKKSIKYVQKKLKACNEEFECIRKCLIKDIKRNINPIVFKRNLLARSLI